MKGLLELYRYDKYLQKFRTTLKKKTSAICFVHSLQGSFSLFSNQASEMSNYHEKVRDVSYRAGGLPNFINYFLCTIFSRNT